MEDAGKDINSLVTANFAGFGPSPRSISPLLMLCRTVTKKEDCPCPGKPVLLRAPQHVLTTRVCRFFVNSWFDKSVGDWGQITSHAIIQSIQQVQSFSKTVISRGVTDMLCKIFRSWVKETFLSFRLKGSLLNYYSQLKTLNKCYELSNHHLFSRLILLPCLIPVTAFQYPVIWPSIWLPLAVQPYRTKYLPITNFWHLPL